MKLEIGFGAAVLVVAAGTYWWLQPGDQGRLPYRDATVVTQGRAIYGEYCAACHGGDLAGQPDWRQPDSDGYMPPPPHDPSGHTWHHPDRQLFMITKLGTERIVGGTYKSRMSGFGEILADAEIVAVLAYIKSTWPEEIIRRHDRINAEAGG